MIVSGTAAAVMNAINKHGIVRWEKLHPVDRYLAVLDEEGYSTQLQIGSTNPSLANMLAWVDEEAVDYRYMGGVIAFRSPDDAVYFKVTWADELPSQRRV